MSSSEAKTTGPGPMLTNDPLGAARATLILAHGAGAGMDHPFMEEMASALSERDIRVVRFEFPYMQRRRQTGKGGGPDRPPVLESCWTQAIARTDDSPLFIGGKSMGGRIASMVADRSAVDGLICLGYPFHPPGKPERLRTAHLQDLKTRCLIVQGERDPFGGREETASYALSSRIRFAWLPDGDHSFKPRKASGHSLEENMARAIDRVASFVLSPETGQD